jgi:hypothetical protein
VRGRGRAVDPAWAHRLLLLQAGDSLSDRAKARLEEVFTTDDPTGKLKAAWDVKEQVRTLLRTGSLGDAELAKEHLEYLVKEFNQLETTRLWRTMCRWWKEIEVLIVTGVTTGKVEANNTSIKHIKRTGRGFVNSTNYTTRIMLGKRRSNSGESSMTIVEFTTNRGEPSWDPIWAQPCRRKFGCSWLHLTLDSCRSGNVLKSINPCEMNCCFLRNYFANIFQYHFRIIQ